MTTLAIDVPSGGITNTMIQAGANILSSKLISMRASDWELFAPATSIAAKTQVIHTVYGATGTLKAFQAAICGTIATGGDRTVTVDLQRSRAGGAFATVLSSTIGFTNGSVLRTAASAVFSATDLVAGDILEIIVTVAGAAGNQALGLNATLTYDETPA